MKRTAAEIDARKARWQAHKVSVPLPAIGPKKKAVLNEEKAVQSSLPKPLPSAGAVKPLAGGEKSDGGHLGEVLRELVAARESRERRRSDGTMPDEQWTMAQDLARLGMMREICRGISGIGWCEKQSDGRARVRRLERHLERLERRISIEARKRIC
jgi:hypothetical protein